MCSNLQVRELLFAAAVRQEMAWFDEEGNSSGALCARLETDASLVKGASLHQSTLTGCVGLPKCSCITYSNSLVEVYSDPQWQCKQKSFVSSG